MMETLCKVNVTSDGIFDNKHVGDTDGAIGGEIFMIIQCTTLVYMFVPQLIRPLHVCIKNIKIHSNI